MGKKQKVNGRFTHVYQDLMPMERWRKTAALGAVFGGPFATPQRALTASMEIPVIRWQKTAILGVVFFTLSAALHLAGQF
jgi:hypothetical protein